MLPAFDVFTKYHRTIVFLVVKILVDENLLHIKTIILLNLAEYPLSDLPDEAVGLVG